MKRYTWIWDEDGFWFYAVKKGTPLLEDPKYEMVLASDVADLERRYRKAVELLRSEQKILTDDEYDRWDNERIVFLSEEGEA